MEPRDKFYTRDEWKKLLLAYIQRECLRDKKLIRLTDPYLANLCNLLSIFINLILLFIYIYYILLLIFINLIYLLIIFINNIFHKVSTHLKKSSDKTEDQFNDLITQEDLLEA